MALGWLGSKSSIEAWARLSRALADRENIALASTESTRTFPPASTVTRSDSHSTYELESRLFVSTLVMNTSDVAGAAVIVVLAAIV